MTYRFFDFEFEVAPSCFLVVDVSLTETVRLAVGETCSQSAGVVAGLDYVVPSTIGVVPGREEPAQSLEFSETLSRLFRSRLARIRLPHALTLPWFSRLPSFASNNIVAGSHSFA